MTAEIFVDNLINDFRGIETDFSYDGGYTFQNIGNEAIQCAEITLNKLIEFNNNNVLNEYFNECLKILKDKYNV